jgi:LPXTG-motif cell wall-anchored protein
MTVRRIAALGTLVLTLTASQPAAAHVRVAPAKAGPGDSVEFELLVAGETRAHTIEVALRIPDGVQPSSFERVPGWHRQLDKAADGSIEVVRWHGELPRDGTRRFAFVATTPDHTGDLVWKAVQRYDDGSEAAWIGPRGSDRPAPVTRVGAVTGAADDDSPAAAAALVIGGGLLLGALAVFLARRRRHRPHAEAW